MPLKQKARIRFFQGSLMHRDQRLSGYGAAAVIEVIEHLDAPRLAVLVRVLFEHAKPNFVVMTTPNVEYNARFGTLRAGMFRHKDHRFEWTRAELQGWAGKVGERFGYSVEFRPVGNEDPELGPATRMGVFRK